MFPLFYSDAARGSRSPRRRPLQSLPGLDLDRYPEVEDVSELESFGDMAGTFEMPFPVGFPFLDFVVFDLTIGDPDPPELSVYRKNIQLQSATEWLYLESLYIDWPNQGSDAYPETNPTGGESPVPLIQISSSDPRRRKLLNATQGPTMFERPIRADHINGQSIFGNPNLALNRRGFWFSPRDVISIAVERSVKGDPFPNWVSVALAGRMITDKFLQGFINEKR